jgi:hypothetical protein
MYQQHCASNWPIINVDVWDAMHKRHKYYVIVVLFFL